MYRLYIILISTFYLTIISAQENKPIRIINFAGMKWYVRSGKGNPGNNLWSNEKESVWVDNRKRLHLKIRKINKKWYAAEILSVQPTHYGIHKFYIANRIDLLDKNIVAAVFIYKNNLHEMDIEFSKWKQNNSLNSQYVVQPETPKNIHKFNLKLNGNFTTHNINWQANFIDFQSYHGHHISSPENIFAINNWLYNLKNLIDDNQYKIHINLWMLDNQGPSNKKEVELIIASLDSPISPLQLIGKSIKEITLYPNYDYEQIFIHLQNFNNASYSLYKNNQLIKRKNIHQANFILNFIDYPVGKYNLQITTNKQIYTYHIIKNY